ncbi:MAG: hypothetical protein GY708_02720 [Actinomycetia bacterium]|nr:hypothetical protein [Actinomycetes bacterium]MCP4960859.1 hypothetical protein [Actinomycetes bacterium]
MGQIRRFVTLLGMAAIGLIGYQLIVGDLSLPDAGVRALGVLIAVIVVMKLATAGVKALADSLTKPSTSAVSD